jgi:dihydropteroate synthase
MKSRPQFELKFGGKKVRLGARTLIMGVLNVTPDSFSDGGLFQDVREAVRHAHEMVEQGADWIDVGGESTRPGAEPVSIGEELLRVLPVIRAIRRQLPRVPISIDTTKSSVAEEALKAGASIINDVSGLRFDRNIAEVARARRAPLILMHIRGKPATMQQKPFVRDIRQSLRRGLAWSIRRALGAGLNRSQLIVDPGLGFGKSRRQSFEILSSLEMLGGFRLPIMIGASRKSFVQALVAGEGLTPGRLPRRGYWRLTGDKRQVSRGEMRVRTKTTHPTPDRTPGAYATGQEAFSVLDIGDAAATVVAILGGAHIVRCHSVSAVLPAIRIADAMLFSRKV